MTKDEAEAGIKRAIREWIEKEKIKIVPGQPANYYAFKKWAENNGYSVYWSFKSSDRSDVVVERWFDIELGQWDWR